MVNSKLNSLSKFQSKNGYKLSYLSSFHSHDSSYTTDLKPTCENLRLFLEFYSGDKVDLESCHLEIIRLMSTQVEEKNCKESKHIQNVLRLKELKSHHVTSF